MLSYDINAACSGFLFALLTAERLLEAMPGRMRLAGGGGKSLRPAGLYRPGHLHPLRGWGRRRGGSGRWAPHLGRLWQPQQVGAAIYTDEKGLLRMEGRQVYQFAVRTVTAEHPQCYWRKRAVEPEQLDHVVCHQANHRIIEARGHAIWERPWSLFL